MKHIRKRGLFSRIVIDDSFPSCFHGPKLLFEPKGNSPSFYRCSAFRTSKACKNDERTAALRRHHSIKSAAALVRLPKSRRSFCHSCQLLLLASEESFEHNKSHRVVHNLTRGILRMPTYLLEPLAVAPEHAQYFFSLDFLNFMASTFAVLRVDTLLCVGAPRLFDFLRLRRHEFDTNFKTFLLDLDYRLEQFYSKDAFAQFNMLNYHFFSKDGHTELQKFIDSSFGDCIIFCDPPFAAPLTPLISNLFKLKQSMSNSSEDVPGERNVNIFLILPYYFGRKLREIAPCLHLLDYRVTYENHCRLTGSDLMEDKSAPAASRRRISVVRIFTDLPPEAIPPPPNLRENFRFCEKCRRYSCLENLHCDKCRACTTLHGVSYVHCDICGSCKPATYSHCNLCNRCFLEQSSSHSCDSKKVATSQPKKRKI